MRIKPEHGERVNGGNMDKQINSSKKVIATRVFLIGIIVIIMVLVTDFIYTKINNVKSEFVIEDESVIYKYIMKEADFE